MVLITNYLGAQSVDPETFPTVTSGIGLKYLYTNTGGEGKILVDSIATRVRSYWTNGVNGQDSLGLGGDLVQNTNVALNGYSMTFLNNPLSGFGSYPFGARKQYVMIDDLNNNLATISTSKDTTIGSETLRGANMIVNLGNNNEVGFFNQYTLSGNSTTTYWQRKSNTGGGYISMGIGDTDGFVISPFGDGGLNPYTGTNIFTVKLPNTTTVFTIKANGIINEVLPAYADDADAGANGLVAGDRYQTSGAGASPLNVAGIVMIKQ